MLIVIGGPSSRTMSRTLTSLPSLKVLTSAPPALAFWGASVCSLRHDAKTARPHSMPASAREIQLIDGFIGFLPLRIAVSLLALAATTDRSRRNIALSQHVWVDRVRASTIVPARPELLRPVAFIAERVSPADKLTLLDMWVHWGEVPKDNFLTRTALVVDLWQRVSWSMMDRWPGCRGWRRSRRWRARFLGRLQPPRITQYYGIPAGVGEEVDPTVESDWIL